tara:strand:- start:36 stop:1976 length:1941 start_codon:yes stop_codon:yes gene_type:complete
MATVIKIKKSTGSTAPTALGNGELGYTQAAGTQANGGYRLYVGAGTETDGEADHIDVIGGKYFTDMLDHAHGTVTASSAVILDANSKVDTWNVDNININGNTISSTDTNGNITLDPNGSGVVDVNTSRISNVTDPTQAQDAATKSYVDATSSGLDVKSACLYATTAALPAVTYANGSSGVGATLTANANAALSVDGGSPSVDDRILVKDQAAQAQNGIYTVTATGSGSAVFVLTRATDYDTTSDIKDGTFTFVQQGTANADNGYVMTTNGDITVGTTAVAFDQFSGAGQITAGAGLTKTGNTIDIGAGTGITVNANDIQVATNYAGGTSIVSLGTVTTGAWNATAVGTQYGGTGQNFSASTGVMSFSSGTASVSSTLAVSLGGTGSANASDARTALGLTIGSDVQAYDAQLADVAGLTPGDGGFIVGDGSNFTVESGATARTSLGLTIGTDVQAYDADLAALAGLTSAADKGIQFTGSGTAATYDLTAAGKALLDDANAAAQLVTLGVNATAAELNIMDGDTAATSTTLADADRVVVNDDGTMKQVAMTDFEVYMESSLDTLNSVTSASSLATVGTITTGVWQGTDVGVAHGGTGLSAAAKGSVLVANAADTISALDGGGSNDGLLFYTASSDTIAWATSLDGGTF